MQNIRTFVVRRTTPLLGINKKKENQSNLCSFIFFFSSRTPPSSNYQVFLKMSCSKQMNHTRQTQRASVAFYF